MRGEYYSVLCKETNTLYLIEYVYGATNFLRPESPSEFGPENVSKTFSDRCKKQGVVFVAVTIPAKGCLHFVPLAEEYPEQKAETTKAATTESGITEPLCVETDAKGWSIQVRFVDHTQPVVCGGFGEFVTVNADGFSPRWTFKDIFENDDATEREQLRKEHLFEVEASYGQTTCNTADGSIRYEQEINHPALKYGKRILDIDTINNRISLELRMDRRSDFALEVLFLRFAAPETTALPTISDSGSPFRPIADQFPGSCMDFYAIDGWIHYPNGWMLNCRDNALVTFRSTSVVSRKTEFCGQPNDIYAKLFDNIWDTNFTANVCGMMQFYFTVAADIKSDAAAITAEAMDT